MRPRFRVDDVIVNVAIKQIFRVDAVYAEDGIYVLVKTTRQTHRHFAQIDSVDEQFDLLCDPWRYDADWLLKKLKE